MEVLFHDFAQSALLGATALKSSFNLFILIVFPFLYQHNILLGSLRECEVHLGASKDEELILSFDLKFKLSHIRFVLRKFMG